MAPQRNALERPRVAFQTLGCKLNQYETDAIATAARALGFEIVEFAPGADAYVVNSCTVTAKADRKSRNTLGRALRFLPHAERSARPGAVFLTGCFVDSHPELEFDERTIYLVDNAHKNTIPQLLEAHFNGETVDPAALPPDVFDFATPGREFHTRTNLKVQDGCDNFCSFCIIPFVRGRARSRPVDAVLRQARDAVSGGSRELVLTGVNMSRYHDAGHDFVDLIGAILEEDGEFRLRISSLEPDGLDERFAALFRHPKMTPHLHLCLQSGSDRTLLAMRRMYTVAGYRSVVRRVRSLDPLFNLTTDSIVGHPTERTGDHDATLRAIEEFGFGHVHVFPYSLRRGTRAERMPGQLSRAEITARQAEVQRAAERSKRAYRSRLVGLRHRVLVERAERRPDGTFQARGLSQYYVPLRFAAAGAVRPNTFVEVVAESLADGTDPDLIGRALPFG